MLEMDSGGPHEKDKKDFEYQNAFRDEVMKIEAKDNLDGGGYHEKVGVPPDHHF